MDSRDPSTHSRQGMIMTTPPCYPYQHLQHNNPNLMPNPTPYAFTSVPSAPFDPALLSHHQQQQHRQQNGSSSGVSGATPEAEPSRRRRGRPRKYSPDGTGLVLSSNSQVVSVTAGGNGQKEVGEVNGEGTQGRRQRGRPPGSGKKQLDALGGAAGSGFTIHVMKVFPKEDIVSKINDACQEGPRTILIISAYGAVWNATVRLPGSTDESGTVYHEGCCNILSLSGPFFCMNYDGSRSNNFELTVVLSPPDCIPLGGRVVGKLIAANTVQIIVASFIAEPKKSNGGIPPASSPLPTPFSHMLAFGGSATANESVPRKAATDSSEDNGASGSHSLNHTHNHQPYNNNTTNYPMHSMAMYQPSIGWSNSGIGDMHHNNNG